MIGLDEQHWVSPIYLAEIVAGEPVNREPDKHEAIVWAAARRAAGAARAGARARRSPIARAAGSARMTSWRDGALIGVGEAMVEFAPVGGGLYAQGFAGDTLNTLLVSGAARRRRRRVRYLTRVGAGRAVGSAASSFSARAASTRARSRATPSARWASI